MSLPAVKYLLLRELTNFVNDASGHTACDLLSEFFRYFIACAEDSEDPIELFRRDGYSKFIENLGKALPKIESSLFNSMCRLGNESVVRFRKVRSGLQFLEEKLVKDCLLHDQLKELCRSDFVQEIDERLEHWKKHHVEGEYTGYPTKFRFLPETHTWWLDQERVAPEKTHECEAKVSPRASLESLSEPSTDELTQQTESLTLSTSEEERKRAKVKGRKRPKKRKTSEPAQAVFRTYTEHVHGGTKKKDANQIIIESIGAEQAEQVLALVVATDSTMELSSNEETLHFNGEFRIHPLALKQLLPSVLGEVLYITRKYKATVDKDEYLRTIQGTITMDYRMITDTEINEFKKQLRKLHVFPKLLCNIQPAEAFQLREAKANIMTLTELKNDSYPESLTRSIIKTAFKWAKRERIVSKYDMANCIKILTLRAKEKVNEDYQTALWKDTTYDNMLAQRAANCLLQDEKELKELIYAIDDVWQSSAEFRNNEKWKFGSKLSVFYNWKKHGRESMRQYYHFLDKKEPRYYSERNSLEIYFRLLPEELLRGELVKERISQNGERRTLTYVLDIHDKKYVGHFDSERLPSNVTNQTDVWSDIPTVVSHYLT